MTIKQTLKSPVAKVSAGLGAITAIAQPEILFAVGDALIASGPQIFSALTVSALTLPRFLPPDSTVDWILVAAAALFVLYLAREINENFEREGL
ncbi:hypothetical protein [Halorubrum sp. CBA1229]|uniref:hypothetical protein n=1 Tax=Halorubrum sp. CBA1229 TaxID=1853699 RepID=UPI000F3AEBBD|nr:hypothetical protein [Halorubrum sp. CBA1229]QKY17745.1 hypothetical protein Hrr1229_012930 [Halorubrum sp. CBA1229]